MAVRRLIATLLLLPALSACSDDEPGSSGSGEPTTPATSAPTPTETPPPTEPPEAGEKTEAGAKAFVEYWVDAYSDAVISGDTSALEAESADTCRACRRIIDLIREIYDGGGSVASDGWQVRSQRAVLPSDDAATVLSILRLSPERIHRPDEPVERHPGSRRADMTFDVVWTSNGWQMRELFQGHQ